jgi:glycosyltransferase involved in cell wall biosynthesis
MNKKVLSKPPIAIIAPHPMNGGGVLSSLKVVYEFCEQYFTPKVYCLSFLPDVAMSIKRFRFFSSSAERMYEGMRCVEIGAKFARIEPLLYWLTVSSWEKYLSSYKYVFVTGGTPHLAQPAVLLKKKFVLWLASTYADDRLHRMKKASFIEQLIQKLSDPLMLRLEKQILSSATVLLPISSYTKKLCEGVLGESRKLMKTCPVPVDLRAFTAREHGKKFRIIAVGRFTDVRKNLPMLLAVCEELLSLSDLVSFDIVGLIPQDDLNILNIVKKFPDRITFHGFVDQQKLDELYKKAFVSLITSEQEGLAIVGLDALSWGIPVISTRCGGVEDYVIPGMTGILVDLSDIRQMVDAVLLLMADPEKYLFMSQGALSLVSSTFSKRSIFIRFQWALCNAYPELEKLFLQVDESMEDTSELTHCRTRIPVAHQ